MPAISGRFLAAAMNVCQVGREELNVVASAIFESECKTTRRTDTWDGRRRKRERDTFRYLEPSD